jgi:serine protease Do
VLISTVRPGSFGDDIRVEKGYVIIEINKKPVADEAAYRAIVNGLKSGQDVVFKVRVQGANAPAGATFFGGTLP